MGMKLSAAMSNRRLRPPAANRPPSLEPGNRPLEGYTPQERLEFAVSAVCFADKVLSDVLALPLVEKRSLVQSMQLRVRAAKQLGKAAMEDGEG